MRSAVSDLEVVEICAGAGGQSLGLELAGFRHRLANEIDADACATLRLNRPDWEVAQGDVYRAVDPVRHTEVALLAGGTPCPPFSIAGQQHGTADERDLFAYAVGYLVPAMRPHAVMLENVRGLSAARFAGYRQWVMDTLADAGYVAEWQLLHASDYGVPQLRPRFVLVALRPEYAPYFEWPKAQERVPTVGETIGDLMGQRGWPGTLGWMRDAADIGPTIVGGSKKHGGADLGPRRAKAAWRKLRVDAMGLWDQPPSDEFAADGFPRLTNAMVARIQGWLDETDYAWRFSGRKTATYRQIGNAFPPPVARAVATQVARALRKEGEERTLESVLTDRSLHDAVYRVLRETGPRFVSETDLSARARAYGDTRPVERRLRDLSRDFTIEQRTVAGEVRYRLGPFKGFVGQEDHHRHEHFAATSSGGGVRTR
jgi:DNA (cytosine-5)-methyltransferase 1